MQRLCILLLAVLALPLCAFDVPRLTGPVVDRAGMLSAAAEGQIANALRRLHQQPDGAQIAVLTVPNLGDETIEQASIQVVDAWQLGSEAKDKGILLMIAQAERRIRIEVGQGLEGDLPDAYAKRMARQRSTAATAGWSTSSPRWPSKRARACFRGRCGWIARSTPVYEPGRCSSGSPAK